MEIFSLMELSEIIHHVEIEGQGGIFKEETGKLPKDHPKEFLSRLSNYSTNSQLIQKIHGLSEDEALHIFVKSVYVVRTKQLESASFIEKNGIIYKVFEDYLLEAPAHS